MPLCALCKQPLTFFFQIAFPESHSWAGLTLATFTCIDCVDESYFIPEMLHSAKQAEIPRGFLDSYQQNFRFLTFRTEAGSRRSDYVDRIQFKPITLTPTGRGLVDQSRVGGTPVWVLEDEAPGSYAGSVDMVFLLQLQEGLCFDLVSGATPPMEIDLSGKARRSVAGYCKLFIGNTTYLFGTANPDERLVYAITQID